MSPSTALGNWYATALPWKPQAAISLWLAGTPCGPLRHSEVFPGRELLALVARTFR